MATPSYIDLLNAMSNLTQTARNSSSIVFSSPDPDIQQGLTQTFHQNTISLMANVNVTLATGQLTGNVPVTPEVTSVISSAIGAAIAIGDAIGIAIAIAI